MSKIASNILTKQASDSLHTDLQNLEINRPEAVAELTWARDLGDRSENAAYKSARIKLSRIDSRIRFLKKVLGSSRIVENTQIEHVNIGCRVTLKMMEKIVEYVLVGDHETDPIKGKISHRSPIGKEIIGKKVNQKVSVFLPKGIAVYEITKISLNQ